MRIPIVYWFARIIRRLLPYSVINYLQEHKIGGYKLGRDTILPRKTAKKYLNVLVNYDMNFTDLVVLVVGYGGSVNGKI